MRKIICLLGLLVGSAVGFGQTSAVTATITDTDGTAWASGPYTIQLVNSSGQPIAAGGAYRIDTGATITNSFSGTLDGSGALSVTLTTTSNINPAGTKWKFGICPNTIPATCGGTSLAVSASGSLSSQLSASIVAPRIGGGQGTQAYADVEVATVPNNSYYNITTPALRCYAAAWAACGSGGGTSLLSQKVVYASKLAGVTTGVAVIPGSTASGCTTSDTQLNAALLNGNVDLEIDSGFCLANPLVLYSNTTLHCVAPEFGVIMAQNSNNNTFINAHQNRPTTVSSTTHGFLVSNITDQDITISGCTINSNSVNAVTEATHRYQNGTSTGQALMGVQMLGITNFKLINNLIYDTPTWGVLVSNANGVTLQNNRRQSPTPLVQNKNDDGFDMIGPINNVNLSQNYSQTGDDAFCICADGVQDASNSGDTTYYPHYHPIPFNNGPVTNVLADGLFCDASINCYDLLSTTELIDRVQLDNTNGTVNSIPFRVTKYNGLGSAGLGNVGSVRVDGWNVQPTQSGGVFTLSDHFDLDVNASNLAFSHITEDDPVDGYPIFYQRSGALLNLSINGIEINNTTGTAATYVLQTAAGTSNPVISNVAWTSNGNGKLLGGAVVPAVVTVSNYEGPNAVLDSGYAPAVQNGDAFTNTYSTTYVNTTFNEQTAGTLLATTTPAVCANGCTGTWTATSGQPSSPIHYSTNSASLNSVCTSGGTYQSCPVYINTGHTAFTMRVNVTQFDGNTTAGLRFIVRYTDANNFVEFAQTSTGVWQIFDIVSGTATSKGTGTLGTSTGQWTVIMNGTSATLKNPAGTTLTGTIVGNLSSNNVAVDSDLSGSFGATAQIISSLSVKSN